MVEETWLIRGVRDVLNRIEDVGLGFRAPNPKLLIVFFYDLYCPGCAVLEDEAGDYFIGLVDSGMASLYFVDYPVHKGIEKLHATFRCIYKKDPRNFLDTLRKHYEAYLLGKLRDEEILTDVDGNCIEYELPRVSEAKTLAKQLGVPGTPTIIVGNLEKNLGQGIFGYSGLTRLMKLVEEFYL